MADDKRRGVLKVIAGCASAGLAGVAVAPAVALVGEDNKTGDPPEGASGNAGGWYKLAKVDAVELGKPYRATITGSEVDAWTKAPDRRLGAVWVLRENDTRIVAWSAVCPHLGCAIHLAGERFECPCHDSYFNLKGEATTGPSPRGMDPLEVRVTEGWIHVRYQRFRLGGADRVPV